MIKTNEKWHKTYVIENCEVVGFNRLHDLIPNQYGKKNYCLHVLIDENFGRNLLYEITQQIESANEEYKSDIREFTRITNEIDGKLCPKGTLCIQKALRHTCQRT